MLENKKPILTNQKTDQRLHLNVIRQWSGCITYQDENGY